MDPAEFREVLGNFASGVTVIAAPGGRARRVRLPVVLRGVPAWIDCAIHAVHTGGDHLVVIGLVRGLGCAAEGPEPLLFHRGGFGRLTS